MSTTASLADIKDLRYVWQMYVPNKTTIRVVDAYTAEGQIKFTPGEESFHRVLGTPNCGTTLRMLKAHAVALGRKEIKSIEVFPADE